MGGGGAEESKPGTLSMLETATVRSVLCDTSEKLGLLSMLTVDASAQAVELSHNIGEEISRVISSQRALEERFEQLITERSVLRNMPNKQKFQENQRKVHEVAEELRETTAQLCRNLKDNPNIADNLTKVHAERAAFQALLQQCILSLEDTHTYGALTELVEDNASHEQTVRETTAREREVSSEVKTLREQLNVEKVEHGKTTEEMKAKLEECKDMTKELKAETGARNRYKEKEYGAANGCTQRVYNATVDDLQDEIESLQQQIAMEKRVHESSAGFLRRKADEMVEAVAHWIDKQEKDVAQKDAAVENMKNATSRDGIELKRIEQEYQTQLAYQKIRQTEEKRERELANEAEVQGEVRERAALKIQGFFRSWQADKAGYAAKAGGGGKKKKKK
mmetsp:Transcript_9341/g.32460  ORF Transcript_9341/g.32460 Transcript_9341/m.32460 type:complete len:394 (-) Transcript_9341:237-1418(-)